MMDFISNYLFGAIDIIDSIWSNQSENIEHMIDELVAVRERGGRLFLIGVGGSAANCSHAAADFRTLCGIKAYALDNLANLTALANDKGWDQVFEEWLRAEEVSANDLVYVMSVGGGTPFYSNTLSQALDMINGWGTPVIGVVGRDGGMTAIHAKAYVLVPTVNPAHVTPHTETMQALIWHLLVSHPRLKQQPTAWEGK